MRHPIVAALLIALAVACGGGGGGSNCDNPPLIAGNWFGSVNDSAAGPGSLGVSFTQDGCDFGGTWQVNFAGTSADNSGTLEGRFEDSALVAELSPANPANCASDVVGSFVGVDTIAGNFAPRNCTTSAGGSFEIRRSASAGPAQCGNNILEPGEQCDDGSRNCPGGFVSTQCPLADPNPCCQDGCVRPIDGFCGDGSP